MNPIELMTREEVAKILETSPTKVTAAIKNGTMPIGAVCKEDTDHRERTIIVKARFLKWVNGEI